MKLGDLDTKVSALEVLERTVPKIERLDEALGRLHSLEAPQARVMVVAEHSNGKAHSVPHEWDRLKVLSKFTNLAGKAEAIEQEWQRIQQDEHNEFFAMQIMHGNNESAYLYKKGIVDGIKWCVNHFS